jgi:hypothetical protein
MVRACSTHGEQDNAYRVLVEKPERKRPQERPMRIWENNIRIDLRETEWWSGLVHIAPDEGQCRDLVNTLMYIRV